MISAAAALLLCAVAPPGVDLEALEKKLRSAEERERQAAVQELGKLGTKESWSLVLDALKDGSPRVADEAEIALAKVREPDVLKELCGKRGLLSKDPWVATHAAGALGGLEIDVPSKLLPFAVKSVQPLARPVYYAALEKLARARRFSPLDAVSLGRTLHEVGGLGLDAETEPEARAARILAASALIAGYEDDLLASASTKTPPQVWCALARIPRAPGSSAAGAFVKSASVHPSRSVRAALVESLAIAPKAPDLELLVALIEKETNERLRWTIDAHLERLAGVSGGGKPEFWRAWAANLPADWKPATEERKEAAPSADATRATLLGMPIVSSRLAILVDFSGSTWEKRTEGKTRKERLDVELAATLAKLPPTTKFNVIPYTNDPIPWEKALAPATPANVKKALDFFTGCKATGRGNFWDAAMLALADPEVDTILALTDGAPTGGHRWNLELMRERLVEKNRFHQVVLDAVLVDAKKGLQDRWRAMCQATGGRMIAVDM